MSPKERFFEHLATSRLFDETGKREIIRAFDHLSGEARESLRTLLTDERKTLVEYLRSLKDSDEVDFCDIRQHRDSMNRDLIRRLERQEYVSRWSDEIILSIVT